MALLMILLIGMLKKNSFGLLEKIMGKGWSKRVDIIK